MGNAIIFTSIRIRRNSYEDYSAGKRRARENLGKKRAEKLTFSNFYSGFWLRRAQIGHCPGRAKERTR